MELHQAIKHALYNYIISYSIRKKVKTNKKSEKIYILQSQTTLSEQN